MLNLALIAEYIGEIEKIHKMFDLDITDPPKPYWVGYDRYRLENATFSFVFLDKNEKAKISKKEIRKFCDLQGSPRGEDDITDTVDEYLDEYDGYNLLFVFSGTNPDEDLHFPDGDNEMVIELANAMIKTEHGEDSIDSIREGESLTKLTKAEVHKTLLKYGFELNTVFDINEYLARKC